MKIRKIDKNERLDILKGDIYAYSRWTNQDLPRSHLTAINPDEVLAAEIDGKIVAALQCFNFQQSVRGVVKYMGGIGGVWTYPEYRNRGCVKALMKSAFLEMRMHGMGLSMLTPFKESFYEALGYTIANANSEVNIPVAALSNYLQSNSQSNLQSSSQSNYSQISNQVTNAVDEIPDRWQCLRLPATEARDIVSNFLYEGLRSQTLQPHDHGVVLTNFTYDQWWHLHRHKLCVVIKRDRQVVALAIYGIDSSGNLPLSDRQIEISAIFWTDLSARDRLWQFLASHRDQVHSLKVNLPIDAKLHQWFRDAGKLTATNTEPWMVRIIDVIEALQGLPIACEPFTFALSDPHCHWNEGVFGVNGDHGQLLVKRYSNGEAEDLEIDFHATIMGISALVYGTHEIEELVHKKWITKIHPSTLELLTQWFTPCVIYNPFKF